MTRKDSPSEKERREVVAELQRLITEGIESGVSTRTPEELLEKARRRSGIAER
jgi:antitoxin ParD1/3/4